MNRSDSVQVTLQVPDTALSGVPVPVRATLRNVTDRPLELYLRGRDITLDVIVTNAAGDTVWRRLEDEVVPAILQLRPVAAGGSLEAIAMWSQVDRSGRAVAPGVYRVMVEILAEGEPFRSESAWITVTRR